MVIIKDVTGFDLEILNAVGKAGWRLVNIAYAGDSLIGTFLTTESRYEYSVMVTSVDSDAEIAARISGFIEEGWNVVDVHLTENISVVGVRRCR